MSYTYGQAPRIVSPLENHVGKLLYRVFEVSPDGISAQVGQLNHTRELTVHEHRGFYDVLCLRPEGALLQKSLHQL